jgi:hypothetical protein
MDVSAVICAERLEEKRSERKIKVDRYKCFMVIGLVRRER